jgi:hypothetical protein
MRILRLLVAVLLTTAFVTTVLSGPAMAAGLTATFTKTQDWGTGFEGKYTITNGTTSTINGWSIQADLPAGFSVTGTHPGRRRLHQLRFQRQPRQLQRRAVELHDQRCLLRRRDPATAGCARGSRHALGDRVHRLGDLAVVVGLVRNRHRLPRL